MKKYIFVLSALKKWGHSAIFVLLLSVSLELNWHSFECIPLEDDDEQCAMLAATLTLSPHFIAPQKKGRE